MVVVQRVSQGFLTRLVTDGEFLTRLDALEVVVQGVTPQHALDTHNCYVFDTFPDYLFRYPTRTRAFSGICESDV